MLQPWPILRRSDKAHPVPTLQYLLRARGHEVVVDDLSDDPADGPAVDGEFGARTDAALRGWQRMIREADEPSMAVDGVAGPMTWQSLVSGMHAG